VGLVREVSYRRTQKLDQRKEYEEEAQKGVSADLFHRLSLAKVINGSSVYTLSKTTYFATLPAKNIFINHKSTKAPHPIQ